MENGLLFKESQSFNQLWLWCLLIAVNGFVMYGTFMQVIKGKQFGNHHMATGGLLAGVGVVLLVTLLVLCSRLGTGITEKGINVRFFPFHLSARQYSWDTIDQAVVKKYDPIADYGGWGVRDGAQGKAYNVSGNQGIQLLFKDGRKLLIGTSDPQGATKALALVKQLKN